MVGKKPMKVTTQGPNKDRRVSLCLPEAITLISLSNSLACGQDLSE